MPNRLACFTALQGPPHPNIWTWFVFKHHLGQGGKEEEKGGSAFGYDTFNKTFLRLSNEY